MACQDEVEQPLHDLKRLNVMREEGEEPGRGEEGCWIVPVIRHQHVQISVQLLEQEEDQLEQRNESLVEGELEEVVQNEATCNVCAVESQVLIESKQEDRCNVIEALVVVLRLYPVLPVLDQYTVDQVLQLLLLCVPI